MQYAVELIITRDGKKVFSTYKEAENGCGLNMEKLSKVVDEEVKRQNDKAAGRPLNLN